MPELDRSLSDCRYVVENPWGQTVASLGNVVCAATSTRYIGTYSGEYVYIGKTHNSHPILGLNYDYIFPGVGSAQSMLGNRTAE